MKLLTKRLSCLLLFCALFFFPSVKANANSMLTAPSVGLNSTVTGTLTQNEGIYFYKIVLPSSGYFSIHNLTSEMDRFGFLLCDATGKELDEGTLYSSGGVPGMGTFRFHLTKGTYYLRLIGNYGDSAYTTYYGSYQFSTSFVSAGVNHSETCNNITAAYPVSSGSVIHGQFSITDKVDFFKISLVTPSILTIQQFSDFEKLGIQIFDSNYQSITGNTLYWDYAAKKGSGTKNFYLSADTYYIRVVSNYWNNDNGYHVGNYQLNFQVESAGVNHTEPADSFPNAAPVSTGTTIHGMITSNDSIDFYKLTLPKATNLKIFNTIFLEKLGVQFYDSAFQPVNNCSYTVYHNGSGSTSETKELSLSAGTYYVRVVGNYASSSRSYYLGKYQIRFGNSSDHVITPTKKSMSKVKVSGLSSRTYTGKSIVPSLTVKYGSRTLTKGSDYVVSAKNNKYPGKATLTLTGKGNYTGKKTVSFYIKPQKARISSLKSPAKRKVSIRIKKQPKVTGYQIYYSTRQSGGYKRLKTTSDLSYTKKLKSRRTYYFKVRAYKLSGNHAIYGNFSPVKSVRIK